jgi:tetratricopeptide (TPR) repeat protein
VPKLVDKERICPQCGRVIPSDQASCPSCIANGTFLRTLSRETILFLCVPVLAALFAFTSTAAKIYHSQQRGFAEDWYLRGEAGLKSDHASEAIKDFSRALAYSRDNRVYRLRLAQALLAANRSEEARPYLLNLWQHEPGNGTVNLELARLAVRRGEASEAIRYFHNAIYGVWEESPEDHRRQVRLDLCEYLLSRGERQATQAALIELAADLPKDAGFCAHVGTLFLKAENYSQALDTFRQALDLDSKHETALRGAGEACFQMANYRDARRYLERAVRVNPQDASAVRRLDMTNLILSLDPLERGLSAQTRAGRVVFAYQQAVERTRTCALKRGEELELQQPGTELQFAYGRLMEIKPQVREKVLRRDPDLLTQTLDMVFEVEQFTARDCGYPAGVDLALLLIARKHGSTE